MAMDVEQKARYSRIMNNLKDEVGYMKRNMAVFIKLRRLVKFKAEKIWGSNWLLNWIVDTYSTDVSMSIRRLVDVHPAPHCNSLYKFLRELKNCAAMNIDANELQHDIDKLNGEKNQVLKKILDFTLRNRAHCDERSRSNDGRESSRYTNISFDEEVFPEAQKIEDLFVKYYKLIEGKESMFMEKDYVEHAKSMIENIDDTFRRIYEEKIIKKR